MPKEGTRGRSRGPNQRGKINHKGGQLSLREARAATLDSRAREPQRALDKRLERATRGIIPGVRGEHSLLGKPQGPPPGASAPTPEPA